MRTAASVGMATSPITPEKAARITIIHRPEQIAAHLLRPPTVWFRAVWPTEPPTG